MMIEPELLKVKSRRENPYLVEISMAFLAFFYVGTVFLAVYFLTPDNLWDSDASANAAVQLYERVRVQP